MKYPSTVVTLVGPVKPPLGVHTSAEVYILLSPEKFVQSFAHLITTLRVFTSLWKCTYLWGSAHLQRYMCTPLQRSGNLHRILRSGMFSDRSPQEVQVFAEMRKYRLFFIKNAWNVQICHEIYLHGTPSTNYLSLNCLKCTNLWRSVHFKKLPRGFGVRRINFSPQIVWNVHICKQTCLYWTPSRGSGGQSA